MCIYLAEPYKTMVFFILYFDHIMKDEELVV